MVDLVDIGYQDIGGDAAELPEDFSVKKDHLFEIHKRVLKILS